jgi:hypothetical protein
VEAHHQLSGRDAEKVIGLSQKIVVCSNGLPFRGNGDCSLAEFAAYSITDCGATKFLLPEGTTLVTMHLILGGLLWLLSL